jgi:hypothetical protein
LAHRHDLVRRLDGDQRGGRRRSGGGCAAASPAARDEQEGCRQAKSEGNS